MAYSVKELFYTLQGEGVHTGRAAVFCRFSGCNLWSGRESERLTAQCQFCDTDFVGVDGDGGGKFSNARDLAAAVDATWPAAITFGRFVVCTGGEPLLQLDDDLIAALHERGFMVAIETNGTLPCPLNVDWVCVSPKAGIPLALTSGNELKFVFPQAEHPSVFEHLSFDYFFVQPKDGPDRDVSLRHAIQFCGENPKWKLSLQTHKLIGIR